MFRKILLLAALLCAAPAHAQWNKATSKHFIIYSDGSEEELRTAATNLEIYDRLLRAKTGVTRPSSPIKVKVYMLRDQNAVERLAGEGVGGFYFSTPRSPIAISARRIRDRRTSSLYRTMVNDLEGLGDEILQHELTHHFMFQYFPTNYPTWYSEGFAEYFGSMLFKEGNIVEIGHAPGFRVAQIKDNWMSVDKLLTARSYADVGDEIGSLYAQGWLLVHYAFSNPERKRQLDQYLLGVSSGKPYDEAAKAAFGDLDKLDKELRDYVDEFQAVRLSLKDIDIGSVALTPLTPVENELLRSDMFLNFGIAVKDADEIATSVADVAAGSSDPYALRILTEAHRAAEQHDAARAAVDRWLAVAPNDAKAMMHKAELEIAALRQAKSTNEDAWDRARERILKANQLAPQDPEVLIAYYDSFEAQGVLPPAGAQNALMTALKLVPQDDVLRQRVAADFEARNMIKEAIFVIEPAAFGLHTKDENDPKKEARRKRQWEKNRVAGMNYMETPRQMLTRLEKKLAEQSGAAAEATSK